MVRLQFADNIVTRHHVYAKFDDDQLWNEKALVDRKSDNNNPKKNNKNNLRGHWGPVSGFKKTAWVRSCTLCYVKLKLSHETVSRPPLWGLIQQTVFCEEE